MPRNRRVRQCTRVPVHLTAYLMDPDIDIRQRRLACMFDAIVMQWIVLDQRREHRRQRAFVDCLRRRGKWTDACAVSATPSEAAPAGATDPCRCCSACSEAPGLTKHEIDALHHLPRSQDLNDAAATAVVSRAQSDTSRASRVLSARPRLRFGELGVPGHAPDLRSTAGRHVRETSTPKGAEATRQFGVGGRQARSGSPDRRLRGHAGCDAPAAGSCPSHTPLTAPIAAGATVR